jgi:inosine/xanthosine triphosphate pyrophosphatase family protein
MKLLNITPETLASNAQCKNRDARRYLARRHAGAFNGTSYGLTAEQAGKAVDALRGRGGVYSSRVGCSATYSQLANSNAPLISKREK